MIYQILHIGIFRLMILSGIVAFGSPVIMQLFSKKLNDKFKLVVWCMYVLVILYFTLFSKSVHDERMINLTPFWSYSKFNQADIRWQVYMNVFLYVPFGFLLPYSGNRTFLQTVLIGLCLAMTTEVLQFILALGLCETDDVIHNTLGCIIGYWYWFAMEKLRERRHKE